MSTNNSINADTNSFCKTASNLSDLGDLPTALTNLGFSQSIASDGYVKLPGGVILQWGTSGIITAASSATITLPIAYTTVYQCFSTIRPAANGNLMSSGSKVLSLTQIQIYNTSSANDLDSQWFTIGV